MVTESDLEVTERYVLRFSSGIAHCSVNRKAVSKIGSSFRSSKASATLELVTYAPEC